MRKDGDRAMAIHLFGEFYVSVAAQPRPLTPKMQRLLALLVLRGSERPLRRADVAEALWPEPQSDQTRRGNLRVLTNQLRSELGQGGSILPKDNNHEVLTLDLSLASVDVVLFDQAIARGQDERAATLYRGELLKGWTEEWAVEERRKRAREYEAARARITAASAVATTAGIITPPSPSVLDSDSLAPAAARTDIAPQVQLLMDESRAYLQRVMTALDLFEQRFTVLEARAAGASLPPELDDGKWLVNAKPDDLKAGHSLFNLALGEIGRGNKKEGEAHLRQALRIFAGPPVNWDGMAAVAKQLAGLKDSEGDKVLAQEYADRSRAIRVLLGDREGEVSAVLCRGDVASSTEEALHYYREAERLARGRPGGQSKDEQGLAWAEFSMARCSVFHRDEEWISTHSVRIASGFESAIKVFLKCGETEGVFRCLDGVIRLLWLTGRRPEAVYLLAACNELLGSYQVVRVDLPDWFEGVLREGRSLPPGGSGRGDEERLLKEGIASRQALEIAVDYAVARLRDLLATAAGEEEEQ